MDKVTVLMSSYNGEEFISTQIDSILNQQGVEVTLLVRDDGSTDSTHKILDDYQAQGKLTWYTGENLRSSKSFMDLIYTVDDSSDFYALSDQDDYWLPDKLATGISHLKAFPSDKPAMYYSQTKLVDRDLKDIEQNPFPFVSTTMKQDVISSGCTGCTVCFNKCLLKYLRIDRFEFDLMHDNWMHKVCMSLGGNFYFDQESHILYRQHGNNVLGGHTSLKAKMKRHWETVTTNKCYRSKSIVALLDAYRDYMPAETYEVCEQIANYHKGMNRWKIVFDKGYRLGNMRLDTLFVGSVILGVY